MTDTNQQIDPALHDTSQTAPDKRPGYALRWWALAVVGIAQLMVVLDATIVTISLPYAQADLGISDGNRQWALTAYTLIFGGLLLLGGRLADYLGRRRMFIIGLVGFALASALAGLAQNGIELFLGRGLQGGFAAILAPAGLSLLTTIFTDAGERARAFAVYGAISAGGAAIGLIAGGALTEYASWRWCLLVNTPIAALAVVGAAAFIARDLPTPRRGSYDLPGAVTVTLGLISLVFGFSRAGEKGWGSSSTIAFLIVGVVLIAVFVYIERRVDNPLLPLRIPGDRNRGGSYLVAMLLPIAMFAMFLFLSYYMQNTLGYTPLKAGVAFLPFPAGIVVAAALASQLLPRFGPRLPMTMGPIFGLVGILYLAQLELGSSYASHVLPAQLLIAFGMGLTFVSMQTTALHGVAPEDSGVASALLNAAQQVGGSIGTALLTTVALQVSTRYFENNQGDPNLVAKAAIHSYDVAFYWGGGFFALALIVVLLTIRTSKDDLVSAGDATPIIA